MSNQFKIGEIAIYVDAIVGRGPDLCTPEQNEYLRSMHNQECEIISEFYFDDELMEMAYEIKFPDGEEYAVSTDYLRKRRPPEQPADDQAFTRWYRDNIITDLCPTETHVREKI